MTQIAQILKSVSILSHATFSLVKHLSARSSAHRRLPTTIIFARISHSGQTPAMAEVYFTVGQATSPARCTSGLDMPPSAAPCRGRT